MTVLLIGKGRGAKAPNSPVQECLLFTASQHLALQETLSGWAEEICILSFSLSVETQSNWQERML